MALNCKPGDLAIVVKSDFGNEGRIVRCLRVFTPRDAAAHLAEFPSRPSWLLDTPLKCEWGPPIPCCADSKLRPIRDNDGEDETLTWKQVPRVTLKETV